jgi:type IV pilus assembly protein PilA
MNKGQQGFTLIEIMIVIAIIGILTLAATQIYTNYLIRAQVSEALNMSAGAKVSVNEFFQENGDWPQNNSQAAISEPTDIYGDYTRYVSVSSNIIEMQFNEFAHEAIAEKKIMLVATENSGSVTWLCQGDGAIETGLLPSACR